MENKQEICDCLCLTLRETRACADLIAFDYDEETEIVTARFSHGTRRINVAGDSGIATIRDIVNHIE